MNYADNGYHFRQDSTFLYYFGIDFPGVTAIIDTDNNAQVLFGNDYTIDDIVWMGPQPTIADRAAEAGIVDSRPLSALPIMLAEAVHKGREIHFLPPYRAEHTIQLHEPAYLFAGYERL